MLLLNSTYYCRKLIFLKVQIKIRFVLSPFKLGHAAFHAIRERGAKAVDQILVVVAADDGVMPQARLHIEIPSDIF